MEKNAENAFRAWNLKLNKWNIVILTLVTLFVCQLSLLCFLWIIYGCHYLWISSLREEIKESAAQTGVSTPTEAFEHLMHGLWLFLMWVRSCKKLGCCISNGWTKGLNCVYDGKPKAKQNYKQVKDWTLHILPFTFASNISLPWPSDLSSFRWLDHMASMASIHWLMSTIGLKDLPYVGLKKRIQCNGLLLVAFQHFQGIWTRNLSNLALSIATSLSLEVYFIRYQEQGYRPN